jgi:hypothetical protein
MSLRVQVRALCGEERRSRLRDCISSPAAAHAAPPRQWNGDGQPKARQWRHRGAQRRAPRSCVAPKRMLLGLKVPSLRGADAVRLMCCRNHEGNWAALLAYLQAQVTGSSRTCVHDPRSGERADRSHVAGSAPESSLIGSDVWCRRYRCPPAIRGAAGLRPAWPAGGRPSGSAWVSGVPHGLARKRFF